MGLATAMSLARDHGRSVAVLEAEDRLAAHQSSHNSGVVHSGLYYAPGSLKARLCVEGREALYGFCRDHGVACERCGKVVVATDDDDAARLHELEQRGRANGLLGLRRLSPEELRHREPHAAGVAALLVPDTGIVDFAAVARAMAGVVGDAGGTILTGRRLMEVRSESSGLVLTTPAGEVRCGTLVNCAGLQADRVAELCGLRPSCRIIPIRGDYFRLSTRAAALVHHLIYPVPDPALPLLGVHLTRRAGGTGGVGGGVEAGPNAVLAFNRHGYTHRRPASRDLMDMLRYPGFWRMLGRHWRTGLIELWRAASRRAMIRAVQRLVPEITADDLEPAAPGIRAQAVEPDGRVVDDFRVIRADRMVHVLNAPSPAATASISIGRHIAGLAVDGD